MLKKILIVGIFFISLQGCGFTPLYKDFSNQNLNITILELSGDRETFNLIQNKLKKFSTNSDGEVFKIRVNARYTKEAIARDASGQTTDYRSKIVSNFQINYKDKTKNISLSNSFDFKKINDQFEELKYEKTIKENMTEVIVQKLISQLLKDQ